MPLKIHHLQVSQSERIVWLCEELGVDYELVLHKRAPLLSPPAIKALNPLGAAPVMEDDAHGRYVKLAESAAIAEYIVRRHGDNRLFLQPEHEDYADFLYWFHAANGTVQPLASRLMSLVMMDPSRESPVVQAYQGRLSLVLKLLDDRLASNQWLAGKEFTAADCMSLFTFTTMRAFYQYDLTGYDNILAWMKRCSERPAYKRAMEKGDPETDVQSQLQAKSRQAFKGIEAMARK